VVAGEPGDGGAHLHGVGVQILGPGGAAELDVGPEIGGGGAGDLLQPLAVRGVGGAPVARIADEIAQRGREEKQVSLPTVSCLKRRPRHLC